MKLSEINEYVQTVAALFAIAGIVFVGIQVRQSNRFAESDFIAAFYDAQIELQSVAIDAGVYAAVAKSMKAPTELTLAELLELDTHYDNQLLLMEKILESGSVLGVVNDEAKDIQLGNFRDAAKWLFPGEFGRTWVENSPFFEPDSPLKAALLEGLNNPSIEAREVRLMRILDTARR